MDILVKVPVGQTLGVEEATDIAQQAGWHGPVDIIDIRFEEAHDVYVLRPAMEQACAS